jgi:hypothetical protein
MHDTTTDRSAIAQREVRHVPYTKIAGVLAMLLGGWLFFAPFALGYVQPARLNDMLVGLAAVFAGIMLVLRIARIRVLSGFVGVLGGWLIVAPALLPFGTAASWNAVTVGATMIMIAFVATVPTSGIRRRR